MLAAGLLAACGAVDDNSSLGSGDPTGPGGAPTETTPPEETPGDDDFDRDEARAGAEALLGLPEAEVPEEPMTRIMRRGDEHLAGTMDLRQGRRNVEFDEVDGSFEVTRVVVEVLDGDPIVVESEHAAPAS